MTLRPLVSVHDQASTALPVTAIPARFTSVTADAASSNCVTPVTGRSAVVVADVDVLGRGDREPDEAEPDDELELDAPPGAAVGDAERPPGEAGAT
jgi:hypothetical protein